MLQCYSIASKSDAFKMESIDITPYGWIDLAIQRGNATSLTIPLINDESVQHFQFCFSLV